MNEREKTAYHEAGHAVVQKLLGGYIREIRIDLDPDVGEGLLMRPSTVMVPGIGEIAKRDGGSEWQRWQEEIFGEIMLSLAGPVAEQLHIDLHRGNCDLDLFWDRDEYWADLTSAQDAVKRWQEVLYPDEDYEVFIPNIALEMVIELLQEIGAPYVQEIAQSLLKEGCLQVPDVPEINPVPDYLSKVDLSDIV